MLFCASYFPVILHNLPSHTTETTGLGYNKNQMTLIKITGDYQTISPDGKRSLSVWLFCQTCRREKQPVQD